MKICCHCASEPCAAQITIFRQLDRESQCRISDLAIHRTVQKGEILSSPERPEGLFLISQGKVKVYELTESGKEKLLRVLGPGDFVGEEALFSSTETYAYAQTLTQVNFCHIRREDFLKLLMDYPSISLKLLEEFNRRVVRESHRAAADSAGSVRNRLVTYLLELSAAQESDAVTLPLPMKELAVSLDTTPETLSRRLKALEQSGLLKKKGRNLTLLDKNALTQLLSQ